MARGRAAVSRASYADAENVEVIAARVAKWLLEGHAQQADGAHAGALAGWIGIDGRAEYVYPEITGYFLHWLAWMSQRNGPESIYVTRAQAALDWLTRWLDQARLSTRVYLDAHHEDWRNDALFTFDLAMVLRGVAAATHAHLISPPVPLIERACDVLSQLIGDDSQFEACLCHQQNADFPRRWSTRRGPFLAKAAAGILVANEAFPHSGVAIASAAQRTFDASLDQFLRMPHDETHPFLYAIEGFLARPHDAAFAERLPAVTAHFDALLERSRGVGRVPESLLEEGQPRLDILAQTIRAGLMLDAYRRDGKSHRRELDALANALAQCVRADGAVPFSSDATPMQLNVWTAMFAEQALTLAFCEASEIEQRAVSPLIV